MIVQGELAKYRPFTGLELRNEVIKHVAYWSAVVIFGIALSAIVVGGGMHDKGLLTRYAILLVIAAFMAVVFGWMREESTGGFIRSSWQRNHLRYAVTFSKNANDSEIFCSAPFFLREASDRFKFLDERGWRDDNFRALIPLDGTAGTAHYDPSRTPGVLGSARLHAERLSEWRFAGACLCDFKDAITLRVGDPSDGETTMSLREALTFMQDAPFGMKDLGEGQCTFAGFHRYQVDIIAALKVLLREAQGQLVTANLGMDRAVDIGCRALRQLYASQTLASSSELTSVRDDLASSLQRLLPPGDKRLPTPVERKLAPVWRGWGS